RRAGSRFDRGALRRFATTWCAASAVGLVAVALGPSHREGIDLQSTELLALALSVTAVAAATAVRDHEARMRFALVEVAGVAALGAVWLHDARDVIWPVHVAALAIFLAATVPALERPD
ncbi:MAG TPA: hypothetical protein VD926_00585, partial [Acidimicrobiales bacterium]|nr:hypothetical protein [Acidimicrobiales bacterium]